LASTVNQEYFKSCLFETEQKGVLQGAVLELLHFLEYLYLRNVFECFFPLAFVQVAGGEDDVVSAVLSHKLHAFHVILFNQFSEISANYVFADFEFVFAYIWYFKEH